MRYIKQGCEFAVRQWRKAAAVTIGLFAAGSAMAVAPTTPAELASSVDFSGVSLAILAVAGVLITVYTTWKGAQFVIRVVKNG